MPKPSSISVGQGQLLHFQGGHIRHVVVHVLMENELTLHAVQVTHSGTALHKQRSGHPSQPKLLREIDLKEILML